METEKSTFEELENFINSNDIVTDNKLIFENLGKTYRVRMPNQREEHSADDKKRKLYLQLIQTTGELTKSQLKKVLKEKQNIDIDQLDDSKNEITEKIKDYYLMLAVKLSGDPQIEVLRNKIIESKKQQFELTYQITNLLSASIEDQCEKIYLETLVTMCTEAMVKPNEWQLHWNNNEEFLNENQGVANKAVGYMTYLLLNSRSI